VFALWFLFCRARLARDATGCHGFGRTPPAFQNEAMDKEDEEDS
jgi:hypothetical protein